MGNAFADASHQMYDLGGGNYGGIDSPNTIANLLFDNYDSGNLTVINTLNVINFAWATPRITMLVQDDIANSGIDGIVIYNSSGVVNNPAEGKDFRGLSSQNSLRFRLDPDPEPGLSQQDCSFDPVPDLWIRYTLRVPVNYKHRDGPSSDNNKFLVIYSDGRSSLGQGSSIAIEMDRVDDNNSDISYAYTLGDFTNAGGHTDRQPLIDATTDQGRWMHIVFHFVYETSVGASDGIIQTFRRWDNESNYTKLHDGSGLPLKLSDSGPQGWANAEILGAANSGYDEVTDFLINDFELSNLPLVPSGDL